VIAVLQQADQAFAAPAAVTQDTARASRADIDSHLAPVRSGLLIFLQDPRSVGDLDGPLSNLALIKGIGLDGISVRAAACERLLIEMANGKSVAPERDARRALDLLAEIETLFLEIPLRSDPLFSISQFVEDSIDSLTGHCSRRPRTELDEEIGFEIDEETMEIFREEATELLEGISRSLQTLAAQPRDRDALWSIRRCAHTFKGAAGVIGLHEASGLAHRVEDLLDHLATDESELTPQIIDLLSASTECLNSLTLGCGLKRNAKSAADLYPQFDLVMSAGAVCRTAENTGVIRELTGDIQPGSDVEPVKPPPAPIVRVALDKLDELLDLTRNLSINRSALAAALGGFSERDVLNQVKPDKAESLFRAHDKLTSEIQSKLHQIRMVKFGMLATRLNRAVHVTCQEEDKKAEIVIANGDCEIDTQILDSLVEPLLHLLRNAVVHGIELPEMRRLIGKPEKGQIKICVEAVESEVIVSVSDDGRGISAARLREKAALSGAIDPETAESLADNEALQLIFLRGLTTAEKLTLNAGRGVGMSIVKESVGSCGGKISIDTQLQKGTTFTIRIPIPGANLSADDSCEPDRPVKRPPNARHVLVVDDSSSMRQLIKRVIEDAGWTCITATDGENVLEILAELNGTPDIILTDLEMPRMNGYELIKTLKTGSGLQDIPIVMVTSRTDPAHKQKALELGAAEFVTKPFDIHELVKIIDRLCERVEIAA